MTVKKLPDVFFVFLITLPFSSKASLVAGNVLGFSPGINDGVTVTGSYFGMDTNADGIFQNVEKTIISMSDGVQIGVAQTATGSHSFPPDGSESPTIDNPWLFSGNTGMHSITGPISETSEGLLDFSSWKVI